MTSERFNQYTFEQKYAFGYCWAFALACLKNVKGSVIIILYDKSEFSEADITSEKARPFHACVKLNNKYFDAHGEQSILKIAQRQNHFMSANDIGILIDKDGSRTKRYWDFLTSDKKEVDDAWQNFMSGANKSLFKNLV